MTLSTAALLTIGTEITTGQIVNRNSSSLAQKLTDLNIQVLKHLSVPDEKALMLEAMTELSRSASILLITGGLGPTSDDFTRNVVAEFLNCPLEFNPSIWDGICTRLQGLGIRVAESNKIQSFFPKGATILTNPAGTAAGFWIKNFVVLPGPPREIEAIWNEHNLGNQIRDHFLARGSNLISDPLFSWLTLGKSESEVGELVEAALEGSGFRRGYRASRPVVEVKVWAPDSNQLAPWAAEIEKNLGSCVYLRPGELPYEKRIHTLLQDFNKITIHDHASGGKILTALEKEIREGRIHYVLGSSSPPSTSLGLPHLGEIRLELTLLHGDTQIQMRIQKEGKEKVVQGTQPYLPRPEMRERIEPFIVAWVLKQLTLSLEQGLI